MTGLGCRRTVAQDTRTVTAEEDMGPEVDSSIPATTRTTTTMDGDTSPPAEEVPEVGTKVDGAVAVAEVVTTTIVIIADETTTTTAAAAKEEGRDKGQAIVAEATTTDETEVIVALVVVVVVEEPEAEEAEAAETEEVGLPDTRAWMIMVRVGMMARMSIAEGLVGVEEEMGRW
jgi:hypothetical protein